MIKSLKSSIVLACALGSLTACDQIRTALHMMPNQDEQQCLNSERMNFKDPDVLFVANLSSRGMPEKQGQYWVRYKAKNSYGAYLQGNMLCEKDPTTGEWKKAKVDELMLVIKLASKLLDADNQKMKSDKSYNSRYSNGGGVDQIMANAKKAAEEILLRSPDDLREHFQ